MNTHRHRMEHPEEDVEEAPRRRRSDKLLTLDRALLLGIFAVGGWVATADLRQADLKTRVEQLEGRAEALVHASSERGQEVAIMRNDMQHLKTAVDKIDENLNKLAEATARMANRLRDDPNDGKH